MEYDKCFNKVRQDFIMEKCETIKSKYVPLGLGQFLLFYSAHGLGHIILTLFDIILKIELRS